MFTANHCSGGLYDTYTSHLSNGFCAVVCLPIAALSGDALALIGTISDAKHGIQHNRVKKTDNIIVFNLFTFSSPYAYERRYNEV